MKVLPLRLVALLAALAGTAPLAAETAVYTIDPAHSGVGFKVRHFVTRVPGYFTTFQGEIHFDAANPAKNAVVATIDATSIDTRNDNRDKHLRSDDYFKTAQFGTIEFKSTAWRKTGDHTYEVTGDLTMVGQTHPVTLEVEYLGEAEARRGVVAGWSATGTIDRTQWGIADGGPAVGDEVAIEINIEARKQA